MIRDRHQAALVAVGAGGVLAGVALILANLPAGRGVVIASAIGLALSLTRGR